MTENKQGMTREEWVQAQVAKAPPWTDARLRRLETAINAGRTEEEMKDRMTETPIFDETIRNGAKQAIRDGDHYLRALLDAENALVLAEAEHSAALEDYEFWADRNLYPVTPFDR